MTKKTWHPEGTGPFTRTVLGLLVMNPTVWKSNPLADNVLHRWRVNCFINQYAQQTRRNAIDLFYIAVCWDTCHQESIVLSDETAINLWARHKRQSQLLMNGFCTLCGYIHLNFQSGFRTKTQFLVLNFIVLSKKWSRKHSFIKDLGIHLCCKHAAIISQMYTCQTQSSNSPCCGADGCCAEHWIHHSLKCPTSLSRFDLTLKLKQKNLPSIHTV